MNSAEQILVNHLESGRYVQATGYLQTAEGHCCLGVACDIFNPTAWTEANDEEEKEIFKFETTSIDIYGLPRDTRLWLNWKTSNGVTFIPDRDGDFICLTELNDGGLTFSEIADVIKSNLVLHNEDAFPSISWPGRDYTEVI